MILIRHGQTGIQPHLLGYSAQIPGYGIHSSPSSAGAKRPRSRQHSGAEPRAADQQPLHRCPRDRREIIAGHLQLPIMVEALVAERCVFTCDVGSELTTLRVRWPDITFDHSSRPWWPQQEETEEILLQRSEAFCRRIATATSSEVAVITHWGFIRAVTGLRCRSRHGSADRPAQRDRGVGPILLP